MTFSRVAIVFLIAGASLAEESPALQVDSEVDRKEQLVAPVVQEDVQKSGNGDQAASTSIFHYFLKHSSSFFQNPRIELMEIGGGWASWSGMYGRL